MLTGKKTFLGIFIAFIPTLAGFFGIEIGPEGASELGGLLGVAVDNVEAIIQTGGALLAAYGRYVTKG